MVDPCFVGLEKTDRAKRGSLRLCSERKRDERTSPLISTIKTITYCH